MSGTVNDTYRFPNWPSFDLMFEQPAGFRVPPYLMLLNVSERSRPAVDLLRTILGRTPQAGRQISAMLSDINWRPQIVGAASMALASADEATLACLWSAFDLGSWVSPQFAAVASITDPEFETNARARIEARCPINSDRLAGTDWLLRHSAAGPGSINDHSAKALAALLALCADRPEFAEWLTPIASRDDVRAIIQTDVDDGGGVAIGWLVEFQALR